MIVTREDSGQLVKVLSNLNQGRYGFHKTFGIVSEKETDKRYASRKRRGYIQSKIISDQWNCQFEVFKTKDLFNLKALQNCQVLKTDSGDWKLITNSGSFILSQSAENSIAPIIQEVKREKDQLHKSFLTTVLMMLLFFAGLYWSAQNIEEVKKIIKPVTVKMVEIKHEIVKITGPRMQIKKKELTKKQKINRAIKNKLGFLGLLGNKSLTKATGSTPLNLKKATAGAGKGGNAGSGGEVLQGLGKGVRRITVGNTGTKGLGGIGTKGAGGGKGGYGNSIVASGEGEGISNVAISNDVTLEGGLSRGVILATIQKYLAQIKACYNNGLKNSPGLEGTVSMNFKIKPTGFLQYARVASSSLGSALVEGCMAKKMMSWQFPKPKGGVHQDVRFPFSLRPESI
jgi:hypothetical protein